MCYFILLSLLFVVWKVAYCHQLTSIFFLVVEMILVGFPKLCGSMNLWAQL